MMLDELLQPLNETETALLYDAIPMIGVLIAASDGEIDENEMDWGEKLTGIRSYARSHASSTPDAMNEYYEHIEQHYEDKFKAIAAALPKDGAARTAELSARLSLLNEVFPKLDPKFAHQLYHSMVTFARHIAKASGGILGFGSISKEEASLIDLPMIQPVQEP